MARPTRERRTWRGIYLRDVVLVSVLLLLTTADALTHTPERGQRGGDVVAYVLVVVLTLPYLVHRRMPLVALGMTLVGFLMLAGLDYALYPGLPLFALVFAIALHSGRRTSVIAFSVSLVAMLVGLALQPRPAVGASDWVSSLLAVTVAWLAGENLRSRRARWAAMEERTALLERERVDRDRQAAVAERLRIARELHDVVAHSMSVIAIQSGVGHHLVDRDPAQARHALDVVSSTSRSALTEMRRLLGVLRDGDQDVADSHPAPGLAQLPTLVARVRDTGLGVVYTVDGDVDDLPAGVDLSAYRIVQEALTNVIKHGGPVATVRVARAGDDLTIDVSDDGSARSRPTRDRIGEPVGEGGHGLVGMRERVVVFGGDFAAGPRPGGGFQVTVRLPCGDPGLAERPWTRP